MDAHQCLNESDLLSLAQGQLEPKKVEALLEQAADCSDCWTLLSEIRRDLEESASIGLNDGESARQPGAWIAGRYRLIRSVGRGGMGEVFEAWDSELGQRIALKMVRGGALPSVETVTRLKREVALARQIAHPNVCRVFDWGKHANEKEGGNFLTMELLKGESLQETLSRVDRLDFALALSIVRQAAVGLAAIHVAGILHRDIKASNIMLCPSDSDVPRAVLLDFGVARELDEAQAALTEDRHVVGTLDYLAPEQLQGEAWTPSSDIYALGVVFFQALVGRVPGAGRAVWQRTAARSAESKLSTADLNRLPQEARRIILACLAPQKVRIQTAAELCTVLNSLEAGSTLAPSPPPRHRISGAVFLALAAGLFVLGFWTWSLVRDSGASFGKGTSHFRAAPSRVQEATQSAQAERTKGDPALSPGQPPDTEKRTEPAALRERRLDADSSLPQAVPKPLPAATSGKILEESNCAPPYYYEAGVRVYRPECL